MPKASRATASGSIQVDGYNGRYETFDGGYTVTFETVTADADPDEFFRGLPDDRCQCEHWGYVIRGKVGFKTADGEETFEAGDAYYMPAGHTPVLYAGAEIVEFSPTTELQKTIDVIAKNVDGAPV